MLHDLRGWPLACKTQLIITSPHIARMFECDFEWRVLRLTKSWMSACSRQLYKWERHTPTSTKCLLKYIKERSVWKWDVGIKNSDNEYINSSNIQLMIEMTVSWIKNLWNTRIRLSYVSYVQNISIPLMSHFENRRYKKGLCENVQQRMGRLVFVSLYIFFSVVQLANCAFGCCLSCRCCSLSLSGCFKRKKVAAP